MSKLRDRIKESTEQSILAAAEERFAEVGLHGAKMEMIAQSAGVSVGTLYNYFKDRDTLLRALITDRAEQLLDNITQGLAGLEKAAIDIQLKQFVVVVFRHFADHGRFMSILQQSESDPSRCTDDMMRLRPADQAVQTIENMRRVLREIFARAIERHELRNDFVTLLPIFLISLCKGTAITHERDHGSADFDGLVKNADAIIDFFLHGAQRRGRPHVR